MSKDNYCIIMAGGVGSRFWPMSTTEKPKQFQDILGCGETLIQSTFKRLCKIAPSENIFIVTNKDYKQLTLENLPELTDSQIITEPLAMNTAPCILYALLKINALNEDSNIMIAPSDHLIKDEDEFIRISSLAFSKASKSETLLTLGIQPTRPDTGYGYIQFFKDENSPLKKVKSFTEKPNKELADSFLASGDFLWNAGIFISSTCSFLNSFKKHMPEMYLLFTEKKECYNTEDESEYIEGIYPQAKKQSIDYGIMEKADNVYVIPSSFGWSDLGTWGSIFEHRKKDENENAVENTKHLHIYESQKNFIKTIKEKAVVISGLEDFLIIDTEKALLICPKNDDQRIKTFVNDMRLNDSEEFI